VAQDDNSAFDEGPAGARIAAEASQTGERQFPGAFGRAPFGMLAIRLAADQPHVRLAVNDAFCQMTGYSRLELGRGDFLADFHPEDQPALEALIQNVAAARITEIRADARLVRRNGGIVAVHLTGSAIQPPSGERYLAVFIEDATAADAARAEIARLEHELQRSRRLESVGHLVGGIAHDFNNLLTVIANYASLVRDEVSVAEAMESTTRWEPVRWDVEQIEDAADRAKRLIKHLLAFARREESQPVLLDLGQLIGDGSRLLREALGEHIPLVTRHGPRLWAVKADPGLLEQVIMNIALNARDAMPAGGRVTIETANIDTATLAAGRPDAAEIAELLPGRYVELRITDTGAGMDAVTAGRAFEPFFTTKTDQAAGLGLSAVRRCVARADGRAWLRSEPGRGTSVTVMLPAAPGSGSGATGPAATAPATVLVVDDETAIRDVAHRVLTSAGYRVLTAGSGPEAIGLLENPGVIVDLLLADVVMPGMTAEVFAGRVQAVRPGIHVLFMSGYDQPASGAGGWPGAAALFVAKPFSRAALLARITQALATGSNAEGQAEQSPQLVRVRRQ
jgi:two-component system, cell cycle sensor histidine kinase and response regulator CckA